MRKGLIAKSIRQRAKSETLKALIQPDAPCAKLFALTLSSVPNPLRRALGQLFQPVKSIFDRFCNEFFAYAL